MTYCAAWTYGSAAYLVADSLVTGGIPTKDERTLLNEPQRQIADRNVSEALLKIRNLRPGTAVAFAGDVESAFRFIDFLSEQITSGSNLEDLFASATLSCGPFDERRYFEILVAQADDLAPVVMKWDSKSTQLSKCDEFAAIGSLSETYKNLTASVVRALKDRNPSADAFLYNAITLIQSYGQHDDLLSQGVGGVIFGLRVTGGSTFWQDDTITVIYADDQSLAGMLSTHFRETIALVNSTYRVALSSIFVNTLRRDTQVWVQQHWTYLKDYLSKHFRDCRRWLFINKDRKIATVLHTPGGLDRAHDLFRIWQEDGNMRVFFSKELVSALWGIRAVSNGGILAVDLSVFEVREPLPTNKIDSA
jgi:hypothetical protein